MFALLKVWVVESTMEVMARQLLLLYLALMPQESMGNNGMLGFGGYYPTYTHLTKISMKLISWFILISEKTEVFLELFGNSMIRSQTVETLKCAASQLTLCVTETQETPIHSCLNTIQLKVPLCFTFFNPFIVEPFLKSYIEACRKKISLVWV